MYIRIPTFILPHPDGVLVYIYIYIYMNKFVALYMHILPRVVLLIPRLSSPRTHRSTYMYDSLYNGDIAPSSKTLIKTSDG